LGGALGGKHETLERVSGESVRLFIWVRVVPVHYQVRGFHLTEDRKQVKVRDPKFTPGLVQLFVDESVRVIGPQRVQERKGDYGEFAAMGLHQVAELTETCLLLLPGRSAVGVTQKPEIVTYLRVFAGDVTMVQQVEKVAVTDQPIPLA